MDLQANCGSISYSYDSLSSLSVSPHYVIIRLKQTQCPAALGGIDGATNTLGLDGGSVGYTGVTMENEGEATVGPSLSGRYYSWQEEFGLSRK